jgi:hypothetical protein
VSSHRTRTALEDQDSQQCKTTGYNPSVTHSCLPDNISHISSCSYKNCTREPEDPGCKTLGHTTVVCQTTFVKPPAPTSCLPDNFSQAPRTHSCLPDNFSQAPRTYSCLPDNYYNKEPSEKTHSVKKRRGELQKTPSLKL